MSRARDTAEVAEEIDLKVDYSTPVNEQTGTSYTFQLADARKLTTASSASAVTLTIPPQSEVTWEDDTILRVVNYGAGAVTVAGGSGVTVTNTATTLAQFESAAAIRTGSDAWTLVPFAGGGAAELTAADISATTGTVSSATSGGYTTYTWTASGSITFSKAGLAANVLVVGGGGSGIGVAGGGGGAGGLLNLADCYFSDTTHTVVVGAGAGPATTTQFGPSGESSRINGYYGVGGGGTWDRKDLSTSFGGSGGGGSSGSYPGGKGTSGQGNDGGTGAASGGAAGGGGAGAVGANGPGGAGGAGVDVSATYGAIGGASGVFAGGGGGAHNGSGGSGGGGSGGNSSVDGTAGTANTGGGGGGAGSGQYGGAGGSGIVAIRVKA